MGILSDADWLEEENVLGLHDLTVRRLFLGSLPALMILSARIYWLSNRETTLGFIRKWIRGGKYLRKKYGGKEQENLSV